MLHNFQNEFEMSKTKPDVFDSNPIGFSDISRILLESEDCFPESSLYVEQNLKNKKTGENSLAPVNNDNK